MLGVENKIVNEANKHSATHIKQYIEPGGLWFVTMTRVFVLSKLGSYPSEAVSVLMSLSLNQKKFD